MTEFEAGVFLVDKPVGPSSFAMIRKVRRLLGMKKVGHAGTLDPFASGLLVICAGRPATKLISGLMDGEKEYIATITLGIETTTHDPEGEVVSRNGVKQISRDTVDRCLAGFLGKLQQVPPAYSALKHKGKPLYYYARQGIEIKKEPREITIHSLEKLEDQPILQGDSVELKVRVVCSKGTYIRTLAFDIGRVLGCGAYLSDLRRTRSGLFTVEKSFSGDDFASDDAYQRFMDGVLSVNYVRNMLQ